MINRDDKGFSVFVSEIEPIVRYNYCKKRQSVKKFCPDAQLHHSDDYPVTAYAFLY